MKVAYARVSSGDQSLDIQLEQLTAAGAEKVFSEKQSGTRIANRTELELCLEFVREGDVLFVTRLDRLARSVVDLHTILGKLTEKGVGFQCLQQPINTTTSEGRLMLTILGAFAEFETEIRRERQMEGIRKAKSEGRMGKPGVRKVTPDQVRKLRETTPRAQDIAKILGVHRGTIYRLVPDGWGDPVGTRKPGDEQAQA